jgi:hypothetical protein
MVGTTGNLRGVILSRYLSFIFLIALSVFFFSAARSQPVDLAGGLSSGNSVARI